ncbi:MAG: Gmad2 immunoglobulin-like domain-containing protein, partial [Nocardioidaceae bacterium]
WWYAAGGAGVAAAATITAIVLVVNGAGGSASPAAGPRHGQSNTSTHHSSVSGHAAAMHKGVYTAGQAPVATMFYIGQRDGRGHALLQTEPHSITSTGSVTGLEAAHEFLTSTPIDPDYTSGWPAGFDVQAITNTSQGQQIALTGPAAMPTTSLSHADAEVAIQALMRTAEIGGPATFTYNGIPPNMLLGVDVSQPVPLAPYGLGVASGDLKAMFSITSPVEGQQLSNPVRVTGSANAFEGTVNWRLLGSSGKSIRHGYVNAGSMGQWRAFAIALPHLSAGTYTIEIYEASAMNGSRTFVDNKQFSVK